MRDRIMGGKRRLTVVTADHFVEFANPIDRQPSGRNASRRYTRQVHSCTVMRL